MNSHLNDADMAELLMAPHGLSPHLKQCAACRTEVEGLRRAMNGLVVAASERPAEFWQRQRSAIREQAGSAQRRLAAPLPTLAWAAAAAVIAVASLLVGVTPSPPPPSAQTDPDHELLLDVERMLQSDVPQALAPAALLAQEISRQEISQNRTNPISSVHKKEIRHED
jgi:hypothetical protein